MSIRVDARPDVLRWALERAGMIEHELPATLDVGAWVQGTKRPTLKQLEAFARRVHVPVGYLFLPAPPAEQLPLPDLRTVGDASPRRPSPDLLDTIYACQERQDWYRTYLRSTGEEPLPFTGTASEEDSSESVASAIREALGLDLEARRDRSTWSDALRDLVEMVENLGVLVMVNGVVGLNTHRPLDPDDFRGFALADEWAPVVFINGKDSKSAQQFTLIHELAHIWLGSSAVSAPEQARDTIPETERWCNEVAAEVLVPLTFIRDDFDGGAVLADETQRLARRFKVSTLVVLRRLRDAGWLERDEFWRAYEAERDRLSELASAGGGGGNFHALEGVRVSRTFARALVASTLEGRTLYRDAFRMLGFRKHETFKSFASSLGIAS